MQSITDDCTNGCDACKGECKDTVQGSSQLKGTNEGAEQAQKEMMAKVQKAMTGQAIPEEMKEKIRANRAEADKLKVKYDYRYYFSLIALVVAALTTAYGAETIYPGGGLFVFGAIALVASRVVLLVNDQIRSLLGQYVAQIDQALEGKSLGGVDPRAMTTTTIQKPPSSGSNQGHGMYI